MALALRLDVGETASFPAFAERVGEAVGDRGKSFDFLLNNAGVGIVAPFEEMTEPAFDQPVNVHLKGVFSSPRRGCR